MHFAASIIVSESVQEPLKYYDNNVYGSMNLLRAMLEEKVKKLIFSSTAAVYGNSEKIPIKESDEKKPLNPYGSSKLMFEKILEDSSKVYDFSYIVLRYFNAAGVHPSGKLEPPKESTLLIPNIIKVVNGQKKELFVFGGDYPTQDGTCIRDYVHVMDLCRAHLLALNALDIGVKNEVFNLGTSNGYSVKEVISTAEKVLGRKVYYKIVDRRLGDPAKLIANSQKANSILKWYPENSLDDIINQPNCLIF